jgi:hypothetical protein
MDSLRTARERPRTVLDTLAWEKHVALVELKKKAELRRLALAHPPTHVAHLSRGGEEHVVVNVKPLPSRRQSAAAACPSCTIA